MEPGPAGIGPAGIVGPPLGNPPLRERITERSVGRDMVCCANALADANMHAPAISQRFATIHVHLLCRATVQSPAAALAFYSDRATRRYSPPIR